MGRHIRTAMALLANDHARYTVMRTRMRAGQATWRELHPSWRYTLWTDDDNRRLVGWV
jgi:hypothetical protein